MTYRSRIALGLALALVLAPATIRVSGAAPWRIPVLMYHKIDTAVPPHDLIGLHLTVMASAFEAQVRLLRRAGYEPLTLGDTWDALKGRRPPGRGAVLTFDDGYEDNYTTAFPILKKYHWIGTFFVVTSAVGTPGHLTRAQIDEMAKAGMVFESHGQHHIDFSRLPLGAARTELRKSRQIIEGWSGHPVDFFAYPAGRFTAPLERLLSDLGYHGALTEIPGFVTPASHPYALERIRVDHDDSLAAFARRLGIPQR